MTRHDPQDPTAAWRQLTEQARLGGRQVWLELYRDRLLWGSAPTWAQDQAAQALAEQLGPSFAQLTAENYECGAQAHRLWSFRYLGQDPSEPLPQFSALDWVFRAVPGGTYLFGAAANEKGSDDWEKPQQTRMAPAMLVSATVTSRGMWAMKGPQSRSQARRNQEPRMRDLRSAVLRWIQGLQGGFRLSYEYEWEYFCRAGTQTSFNFGEDAQVLPDYAWYKENSNWRPPRLAQKLPNAFGLHDLHGTVWELCEDEPADAAGRARDAPFRGGCYQNYPLELRSAQTFRARRPIAPSGFRMVRSIPVKAEPENPVAVQS